MARTRDRSPEQRLKIGRRICIGGELIEIALCVAIVAVTRPLSTGILIAVVGGGMGTAYNVLLWRNLREQPGKQAAERTPTRPK